MAYGTRDNGRIQTFHPDETDDRFYINSNLPFSFSEILEKAMNKWGDDIDVNDINISAEHIQTDCIGYDRYDPIDYTNFIVVEKNP